MSRDLTFTGYMLSEVHDILSLKGYKCSVVYIKEPRAEFEDCILEKSRVIFIEYNKNEALITAALYKK